MRNFVKTNLSIIMVLILAGFIYFWNIWYENYNVYYLAGVYSMGQSLHAFFFNSLDSVGFITIDKPPLGFWIQVLSTKIFGFSAASALLPEAVAGVLAVYLIYRVIKKRFGFLPGIISALVLALTPIFTAVVRNNTIDSILIVLMILASHETIKAVEKSSMKHLIFAGILIGLGFNVKMLQAYMIIPAVYLTYFVFSKEKILRKILSMTVSFAIVIVLSLSWILTVDFTPAQDRPYVGSSGDNSELNLALGYNGWDRVFGSIFGGNQAGDMSENALGNDQVPPSNFNSSETQPTPPADFNPSGTQPLPPSNFDSPGQVPAMGHGAGGEAGTTSLFRLFNSDNAGQISWFLIPALFTTLYTAALIFKKKLTENKRNMTLFYFSAAFVPMFVYFSFANGLAHRYYFAMFSFVIAPLIGMGIYYLREIKQRKYLWLMAAFTVTALIQLYIQCLYKSWLFWLIPVVAVVFATALAIMFLVRNKEYAEKVIIPLMAVLLVLPGIWSLTPIIYGDNAQIPITGPELLEKDQFSSNVDLTALIAYLNENRDGATYLVCAPSSMQLGGELILQSGEPVMVLGGFNGNDSPLTLAEFITDVKHNVVRYALVESNRQMGNDTITDWIVQNGTKIDIHVNGYTLYQLNAN